MVDPHEACLIRRTAECKATNRIDQKFVELEERFSTRIAVQGEYFEALARSLADNLGGAIAGVARELGEFRGENARADAPHEPDPGQSRAADHHTRTGSTQVPRATLSARASASDERWGGRQL